MSSTKKKVIISLSSLVAVILIAACAFVAVFAARNATVTSAFNVSYTTWQVQATVTATYQINTADSATTIKASNGTDTSLVFSGTEATNSADATKAFETVSINFGDDDEYVDFVYTVTNGNGDKAVPLNVALASDPDQDDDNLTYTIKVDSGEFAAYSTYTDGVLKSNLAKNTSTTITIRVKIADKDSDVAVTGNEFEFNLTKYVA